MSAVTVGLGEEEYGLAMESVREVLRPPPITRTPFPPPDIRGVTHLRGSLLPVIDLGSRLRGVPAGLPGRLVVVEQGAERFALLVDRVTGVVEEDLPEIPPAEAEAALPAGWLAGMLVPEDGRLIPLLDLGPVLAGER